MSAYRMWTLTCDECGEVWDDGTPASLAECKKGARSAGWLTGPLRTDRDLCSGCDSIEQSGGDQP